MAAIPERPRSSREPDRSAAMIPSGTAIDERDDEREERQFERHGEPRKHRLAHRNRRAEGAAEIARQDMPQPVRILHGQRPVGAKLLP